MHALTSDASYLLELQPGGELEEVARYSGPAWFSGLSRQGRTAALLSSDRTAIALYRVDGSFADQ